MTEVDEEPATRDMSTTEREFDLVIFGATGCTGKHVVEYLANISDEEKDLKWAVAGRNGNKLRDVLQEIALLTGKDLTKIHVIEAAVDDDRSLAAMCSRTKIVLNCVGPYIIYGEPVVKACIQNGSHHIDISAESLFVGLMQLKYHEASQKAKVYVIGNAGFDSIPCETGIQFLQEKFDGDVCAVETMSNITFAIGKTSASVGTLKSIILHLKMERELEDLHSKLFSNPLPKNKYPPRNRGLVNYSEEINAWCTPFPNTDPDVVNRTQYYNFHTRHMKPIETKSYLTMPGSYFNVLQIAIITKLFLSLCKFKLGRYMLENYPSWMTLGIISKTGPTRQHIKEATFDMYIIGQGHREKLTEPSAQHSHPPDKTMVVKVHGPEPGYTLTPMIMVQTALILLHEREKLPDEGGVFTPGIALCHTTLRERLIRNGVTYEVISD